MKTKSKISAHILRGSAAALLFLCVIVALCSAINLPEQPPKVPPPQDNAAFGANRHENRILSFAERAAYQRAIEDVYWRHRIWPNTNAGPKPSLDAVMSQTEIEKKVTEYLRNSQALEDYWRRPITAEQLQAEMERMANNTKQLEVLQELFEALGNDPFVIAECLARPVLAERLVNGDPVAAEPALSVSRMGVSPAQPARLPPERLIAQVPVTMAAVSSANYTLPVIASPSGGCTDNTWTPTTETNAPDARSLHTAVWTGSEMIIWGGYDGISSLGTGGRYNPSTDSWTATSTSDAPAARRLHTAVWTGTEMIVWGGKDGILRFDTGGRYNPSTDSWTATSTTNAPAARFDHNAVWTGSEMIVWSGVGDRRLNTGGRYNPSTDSWTATSTTNAPEARIGHRGVWSGSEMIVWGGLDAFGRSFDTGGRYNPSTDSWRATSTFNAPDGRRVHSAVWSGSEMIVWGGLDGPFPNFIYFDTGGRYDPGTDTWTSTSTTGAPARRATHTAVWTGSEMIVWGGSAFGVRFDTGGRYNPSTDSWAATSTTDAPVGRQFHTAVWTGSEMIVWGGDRGAVRFNDCSRCLSRGSRYCAPPPVPFTLGARGRKVGGINTVRLTWSGATSTDIDVYRDGVVIVTTANDGRYVDSTGDTGRARYRYRVCEAGTATCSNVARVKFPAVGK